VKFKVVIPREQANRDVDEAAAYYLSEAGEAVAMGFVDALEKAYGHISRNPGTGSPR
jgi:toxin ParE1/3/4